MSTFDDERIRAILLGRRAVRVMPFPGVEGAKFGVRILLDHEIDHARVSAIEYVQGFMKRLKLEFAQMTLIEPEFLDREIERQIIWRSFVDPDQAGAADPVRYFPTPDDVRGLDSVLVETLFQCYQEHMNYVNPLTGLTNDEAEGLVEALGKGLISTAILGQYEAPTLRLLVHSLAVRLSTSPTTKLSSGGSPATEPPI